MGIEYFVNITQISTLKASLIIEYTNVKTKSKDQIKSTRTVFSYYTIAPDDF